MVGFNFFVKSMTSCLLKLKVIPSFCFAFKIPDDPTATNKYDDKFIKKLITCGRQITSIYCFAFLFMYYSSRDLWQNSLSSLGLIDWQNVRNDLPHLIPLDVMSQCYQSQSGFFHFKLDFLNYFLICCQCHAR